MVKKIFVIFICLFSFNFAHSQIIDSVIFGEIEILPEFKGNIMTFIKNNIKYPKTAQKDSIEGIVFVSFFIEETGNTSEHKILRGIRYDLDAEALRVSELINFMKPAMQKGKPIKVKYTLPIEFKLSETIKQKKKGCKKNR